MMSSLGVSVLESWILEQGGEGTVGPRGRRGKWSSALLQPLSFLEMQQMRVANLLVGVGGGLVRNILKKMSKPLGKYILLEPLATQLSVLCCRGSSGSSSAPSSSRSFVRRARQQGFGQGGQPTSAT